MQIKNIKTKLAELGIDLKDIPLGDFDSIGEFTAKRNRNPGERLYNEVGAFYRSNYERGILIYYLIKTGKLDSFLEIGFGRGYATMCAAKAFADQGKVGRIVTIDPKLDRNYVQQLANILPKQWFAGITFVANTSQEALKTINEKFDFVYVDGDHTYDAVKADWELCKDKWDRYILFDDYHLPSKKEHTTSIECAKLIDEIDDPTKELIRMDRRIFMDERGYTDEQVDYGQVLMTKPVSEKKANDPDYLTDWLKG
jgi:hypothetical protein